MTRADPMVDIAGPLVDSHVHVYRTAAEGERAKAAYDVWEYGQHEGVEVSDSPGDAPSALRAMDGAGVEFGVVTTLLDPIPSGRDASQELKDLNTWVCDSLAADARFIPFIGIDLRLLGLTDALDHLDEMVADHGARGVKIHPPLQGLDLDDRSKWPLFEACERLDIAIISHSGPSRDGSGRGEPDAFRPLLDAFPDLRIVLAHLGGARWRQIDALARDFPNVHFDACEIVAWLGAPDAPSPMELVDLIRSVGVERVMMGSDFPWYDIGRTVAQVRSLPGLSAGEQALVLGANACRFFGLDRSDPRS